MAEKKALLPRSKLKNSTKPHFRLYIREAFKAETYLAYSRRIDQALEIAQSEAQARHTPMDYVHFFFGLSQTKGSVSQAVLNTVGLSEENLRAAMTAVQGSIQSTHDRKNAIFNLILKQAMTQGAKYAGTEHALMALLQDEDHALWEVLKILNITPLSIMEKLNEIQNSDEA